jgi:hypothetical protein
MNDLIQQMICYVTNVLIPPLWAAYGTWQNEQLVNCNCGYVRAFQTNEVVETKQHSCNCLSV